jgi:hypothetical protein
MNKHFQSYNLWQQRSLKFLVVVVLALCALSTVVSPSTVHAAQITNRKFTLSDSGGNVASVSYTFNASAMPTTGTPVRSVAAQACTTASGACSSVGGFSSGSSTLASQPSGLGCNSAWSVNTAATDSLRVTHATCAVNPSGAVTVQWNGVHNPTSNNLTFFLRVTTYSDSAWSSPLDTGVVAVSTSQAISLSGTMDETLVFCTGTSITGQNCGTVAGTSVNFGTFSSAATSSGTSVMAASTNGVGGYSITINGSTLTCSTCAGTPTIAALASQTAAATGAAQFGVNLRDNATPNVGVDPSGSGSGTYTANYGTADQYRFITGDSVASAAGATNANAYTVSYIANVPGSQPAGSYSATMTFICTATF